MNTLTKTGGAMNHAKEFLADLSAAFASLDDRRREAEAILQSGERCACIACDQPLTAGTVAIVPVIDLRAGSIWTAAVHRACAEQYGDALSEVIGRKLAGEAVH